MFELLEVSPYTCVSFQEVESAHPPRLFQCSNASGNFNVEEIFEFTQVRTCTVKIVNIGKLLL